MSSTAQDAPGHPRWAYVYRCIAAEVSALTRYADEVIEVERAVTDSGYEVLTAWPGGTGVYPPI